MRILILNDFVQDATSIKNKILTTSPSFELITICGLQEAIEEIKIHGTHLIVINLTYDGATEFLARIKDHPHRIIDTGRNSSQDYFAERLLGLTPSHTSVKTTVAVAPPIIEQLQHSPSFSI